MQSSQRTGVADWLVLGRLASDEFGASMLDYAAV
jgi:hypothetical protein